MDVLILGARLDDDRAKPKAHAGSGVEASAVGLAGVYQQQGICALLKGIGQAELQCTDLLPPKANPVRSSRFSSRGWSAWLWRADDGGGLTLSTASHTVDLLTYLMDSRAERVYAEGRLFGPAGKGDSGYPNGLAGTIAWRSGDVSTVISTDQGQNPYPSKCFVQLADGGRSAVLHAHIQRAEFSGCPIDHFDARELPEEAQRRASLLVNLLEAIDTGGETLCPPREAAHVVAICNALEAAARTGQPQKVPPIDDSTFRTVETDRLTADGGLRTLGRGRS